MAKVVLQSFQVETTDDKGTPERPHVYLVADLDSGQVTATRDPFEAYPDQRTEQEGTK